MTNTLSHTVFPQAKGTGIAALRIDATDVQIKLVTIYDGHPEVYTELKFPYGSQVNPLREILKDLSDKLLPICHEHLGQINTPLPGPAQDQ